MKRGASGIVEIARQRLYALANPYKLDGRVSSHPAGARGWSTTLCYLLVEDDRAVLIGTGFSVHEESILGQLEELVGDRPLTLVVPRVEFVSMCNARPIAERFNVDTVWQKPIGNAADLLDFRPEFAAEGNPLELARTHLISSQKQIPVDAAGQRRLEVFSPQLRLLPCSWTYDRATRTLFTGDVFCWVPRERSGGPWFVDRVDDDPTTADDVADSLLRNRYWWLAGAETERLRADLAELMDRLDVDVIAPDHGCVLMGSEVVAHHLSLLDQVLEEAAGLPSRGLEAAQWSLAAQR